jgi:hypothetical protein
VTFCTHFPHEETAMSRWFGVLAVAALGGLLGPAVASADPDELMSCKIIIIKAPPAAGGSGSTKFVCKAPSGGSFALPSPAAAPTGGSAVVGVILVPPGYDGGATFAPSACLGLGNPAGAKGYKCRANYGVVVIKTKVVKAAIKRDIPFLVNGQPHPYPGTSDVGIKLISTGSSDSKRYCGSFFIGAASTNDGTQFKATNAPAPASCYESVLVTTTTSTTTSSTTTSTVSSPSGAFPDTSDTL